MVWCVLCEVEFGLVVVCAFDDGVDDVGLSALCDLLADEVPDFGGAGLGHAAGGDGPASGWELVDDAGVEVAVDGEGESAGDGRCCHDENIGFGRFAVGAGFAHEFEALLHAEAVLFVDDDEAEVGELDFFFNESVRADGEVGFSAEDAPAGVAFGAVVKAAGEEADTVGTSGVG